MTKTLMTTAIVLLVTSLNANAGFQPWEAMSGVQLQKEVQSEPLDARIDRSYRDDSGVISDVPDPIHRQAREAGPFYLQG